MADREERFLMRQRGIGARDIDDISLNIAADSSERAISPASSSVHSTRQAAPKVDENALRQERFLMRQRGAGARSVDVSLSLEVPAGAPVQAPVVVDNAQREERFLARQRGAGAREVDVSLNLDAPPASSPTGRVSVAGSTFTASSAPILTQNNSTRPVPQAQSPIASTTRISYDGSAVKRRKLSPQLEDEDDQEDYNIPGDDDFEAEAAEEEIQVETASAVINSPRVSSNGSSTSKKRKKKKSVLFGTKKRKTANTGSGSTSSVNGEDDNSRAGSASRSAPTRKVLAETSNPRQSIARIRPTTNEKDTEQDEASIAAIDPRLAEPSSSVKENPKVYSIFNRSTTSKPTPVVPAVSRVLQQHGITNRDPQTNAATKPAIAARPVQQAPPTQPASVKKTKSRSKKQKGSKERNSQVVVTVHRVAHTRRLDFIAEDDELATEQPKFHQKKSPNAVDVLAQICSEIVDKRTQALNDETGDGRNKNKLKRQREAVRHFGDELASRLRMMTTALDHNVSLAYKLKHATRQKTEAREEVLRLRKEREEIELEQDEVRAANEADSNDSNERFELNTLLGDIELAVQRGKEAVEGSVNSGSDDTQAGQESLAMRLQRIGEVVSSANGQLGLLDRIRGFNALLESVLESRA